MVQDLFINRINTLDRTNYNNFYLLTMLLLLPPLGRAVVVVSPVMQKNVYNI